MQLSVRINSDEPSKVECDTGKALHDEVRKALGSAAPLRVFQSSDEGELVIPPSERMLADLGVKESAAVDVLVLSGGAEDIEVTVKLFAGSTTVVQVSPRCTTLELKQLLFLTEGILPERHQLMFASTVLLDAATLASHRIVCGSTIDAILVGSKNKCFMHACTDRPTKIIGECHYCKNVFCGKHRLPESHACDQLQSCRQKAIEKNSNKLLGEKCVADKV